MLINFILRSTIKLIKGGLQFNQKKIVLKSNNYNCQREQQTNEKLRRMMKDCR